MAIIREIETTVLPGHRIELSVPNLPEGSKATVLVLSSEETPPKRSFRENLSGYPGKQLFQSAEEVDAYLRAERDSWDS